MTPPNISFRQKSRRRYIVPTLVILAAVGTGLYFIGSRGGPAGKKKVEDKTPQVSFTVAGFKVASEGKAVADAAALPDRTALVQLFTDYYQTAFVDPKKWSDPQFSSLLPTFSTDAQKTFAKDLGSLTIGEGRIDFARVQPGQALIRISLYYDTAGKPQFAVAAIHFAARATTKAKLPVDVVQDATYHLQRGGSGWQIFSYQAKATQDTPSPSPSPTATPT